MTNRRMFLVSITTRDAEEEEDEERTVETMELLRLSSHADWSD